MSCTWEAKVPAAHWLLRPDKQCFARIGIAWRLVKVVASQHHAME